MLLSLPEPILVRFINDWNTVVDITQLDAAYCDHSLRYKFHRMLSLPSLVINNSHDVTIGLDWFVARGLRTSGLLIEEESVAKLSTLAQYFTNVGGHHIRIVRITKNAKHGSALLPLLASICTKVESVRIQYCGTLLGTALLLRQSSATLTTIRSADCKLDDCAVLDGLHMPRLRCLGLSVKASVELLARFLKLSDQLERVYLGEAQFDASCADLLLASAKSLHSLSLADCQSLVDTYLGKLARDAARLQCLALYHCDGVTEQSLISFITHCPHLTSILFTNLTTDTTLAAIAEHCGPRLRHLILSNVRCGSDTGLDALVKRCPNIESLRWVGVGGSMPALSAFIRAQSQLRELCLGGCRIDDSVLQSVALHGACLHYLCLYKATGYTDAGLLMIARQCTALKEVCIDEHSTLFPSRLQGWWQAITPNVTFSHKFLCPPIWKGLWINV